MRYYLDTNILVYFLLHKEELHGDILEILSDYENILCTSSVCVSEMIHLCQINKIGSKRDPIKSEDILYRIHEAGISISHVTEKHLQEYSSLPFHGDHRDPNDRLIIAQAISDRVPLISSDTKFDRYGMDGLLFVFNER